MTIKLDDFSSGGSTLKLKENLTYPSTITGDIQTVVVSNTNLGLTTALSLVGKFSISLLNVLGITQTDTLTVKLTVDGDVIWNDDSTVQSTNRALWTGNETDNHLQARSPFGCDETLLLEVQTSTDSSVSLEYILEPIV
ncbi:MAG: hypothetical protein GY804_15620 [Alphaproteobacteria bacterium]|nr:hypothetical protein [Alphaproteobacteria bacterium]MCP5077006.1 hypothetical protein [Psychromonas sp.]